MAIGEVLLKLGLIDKDFKKGLSKAQDQVAKSVNKMKNIMMSAALGQYLFAGANDAINSAVDQVKAKLNLLNQGLTDMQIKPIMDMAESFELMGYNAESASIAISEMIVTGKAMSLKSIGVVLDKDTQSMLAAATAAERYEWAIKNIPTYLEGMTDMLPDNIKNMIEMRKTMDDLKKAMGTSFLSVIHGVVNAFGGIVPAMKTALLALTAYKTAMILGNVGIGISKSIAVGGTFAAPVAIAMGVSALATIGVMMGGAGLALGALNSLESPSTTSSSSSSSNSHGTQVVIVKDKFGETQKVVSESSGGNSSNVQTSFGTS